MKDYNYKANLAKDAVVDYSVKEAMEEAMDLYHSLETLFRIWEREGVDMGAVRQKVFEKNRRRGYYKE